MQWPNHYPCPFFTFLETVLVSIKYLIADDKNVISVHCLAGKGRTGSLINSILYASGKFDDVEQINNYYLAKRAVTVTRPSQIRYLNYFKEFYDNKIENLDTTPKKLI